MEWQLALKIFTLAVLSVAAAVPSDIDEGDDTRFVTGRTTPDPNKTCISIRLPWEDQPMYFCTEPQKVKYRRQCGGSFRRGCPALSNGSLIISTPWDCCPYESKPDHCASVECPLPPFNRTCTEIPGPTWSEQSDVSESEIPSAQECCPKYFCEEGVEHDKCHLEITKRACIEPPGDKKNCIGFVDSFGCCPKFDCGGDKKSGMCPMELFAMRYNLDQNGNRTLVEQKRNVTDSDSEPDTDKDTAAGGADGQKRPKIGYVSLARYRHECVGDYNCPGTMKCCSMDYRVYSDNSFIKRNTKPVVGFCMDPVTKWTQFNSKTFDVVI